MKIFHVDWLNRCKKCGRKDTEVKTLKGSRTALWDDDAVTCLNCGLTGVIHVCEGQALCLWSDVEDAS